MNRSDAKHGLFLAISAFTWWGLLTPAYFKWVGFADPVEVLCHRVVFSLPVCAILLSYSKGWREAGAALKDRKVLLTLLASSLVVGFNWGIYIWSVIAGYVLQGSLGYYIVPLLNVLLGVLVLNERLSRWQIAAVLTAAAGTINLTMAVGELPWVALLIAGSFAVYGLLRKTVAMGALGGLLVETALMFPFALAWLIWLGWNGELAFLKHGLYGAFLISLVGIITAVPLLCFTRAARLLRMSTVGLCQYWAPSLMFILAVFVYDEPFTVSHLATFICIWIGCGLYVLDSWRHQSKA